MDPFKGMAIALLAQLGALSTNPAPHCHSTHLCSKSKCLLPAMHAPPTIETRSVLMYVGQAF